MTPTPFINPTSFPAARYSNLPSLLNIIIPNLMIGAGIIFIFVFIYGGFLYMHSDGNAEQIKKVRNLMVYAVVGFSVVLVSYMLIKLITAVFNIGTLPI